MESSNYQSILKGYVDFEKNNMIDVKWFDTFGETNLQISRKEIYQPMDDMKILLSSRKLKGGEDSPKNVLFRTHQYDFLIIPSESFFQNQGGKRGGYFFELKLFKKSSDENPASAAQPVKKNPKKIDFEATELLDKDPSNTVPTFREYKNNDGNPVISYSFAEIADNKLFSGSSTEKRKRAKKKKEEKGGSKTAFDENQGGKIFWKLQQTWADESFRISFRGIFCFRISCFKKVDTMTFKRVFSKVSSNFSIVSKPNVWLRKSKATASTSKIPQNPSITTTAAKDSKNASEDSNLNEDEQNLMSIDQEEGANKAAAASSSNGGTNKPVVLTESQRNIILCSDTPIGPNTALLQNAFPDINLPMGNTLAPPPTTYYSGTTGDPSLLGLDFSNTAPASSTSSTLFNIPAPPTTTTATTTTNPANLPNMNDQTMISDALVNLLLQQQFGAGFSLPNPLMQYQQQIPRIEEQPPSQSQSQSQSLSSSSQPLVMDQQISALAAKQSSAISEKEKENSRKRKRTAEAEENENTEEQASKGQPSAKKPKTDAIPTIASARKTKKFIRGKESLPSSIFTDNHEQAPIVPQQPPAAAPAPSNPDTLNHLDTIYKHLQPQAQSSNSKITSEQFTILHQIDKYKMPTAEDLQHFSQNSQTNSQAQHNSQVFATPSSFSGGNLHNVNAFSSSLSNPSSQQNPMSINTSNSLLGSDSPFKSATPTYAFSFSSPVKSSTPSFPFNSSFGSFFAGNSQE